MGLQDRIIAKYAEMQAGETGKDGETKTPSVRARRNWVIGVVLAVAAGGIAALVFNNGWIALAVILVLTWVCVVMTKSAAGLREMLDDIEIIDEDEGGKDGERAT
jgi:uncharacterized membrane protein YjjP (DUF1212 family)